MVGFWFGLFLICFVWYKRTVIVHCPKARRESLCLLLPAERLHCLFGLVKVEPGFVYPCLLRREEGRELNGLRDLS